MSARSVFQSAFDIPDPAQRAAYVDQACAADPALRREVEELLAAHGRPGEFMAHPGWSEATCNHVVTEGPGTVIGPYRLMEQVGEGGFGLVFVAEQQQPVRRKVALKVIKPGMDTREVVARFEAERQALALMDHPNIARVLDAGSTGTGHPFFVMELVKGLPITEYCDVSKLNPKDRLELFLQVCHAVQHAHQKGVIHRDLKPSNILVAPHDGVPVVKVIDFGVAKALGQQLTEKTVYTRFAQMIGTPLYMSPEQAELNQIDVDTRSDVYSLGVVLYELLTGTTPLNRDQFGKAAFDEIRRIIKEEDPPTPSTRLSSLGASLSAVSAKRGTAPGRLAGLVRGELDWIVMKALEKDRSRRYESAAGLARDLQRYLADEPVEARPASTWYRLSKLARRNKAALTTAAIVAVAMTLGIVMSVWQAVRATNAEAVAVRSASEASDQAETARRRQAEAEAARERLRHTLYAAQVCQAQIAIEANGIPRALALLTQQRPGWGETDLRGFEWYYLKRLCHGELSERPTGEKTGFFRAFSPDGASVAELVSKPGSKEAGPVVKVWDTATGRVVISLPLSPLAGSPPDSFFNSGNVVFSPDGARLAVARIGGELSVIDLRAQRVVFQREVTERMFLLSGAIFSPDGSRLAASVRRLGKGEAANLKFIGRGEAVVTVWDAATGKELATLGAAVPNHPASPVAFDPTGKLLAFHHESRGLVVADAKTSAEVQAIKDWDRDIRLIALAFSPTGGTIVGVAHDFHRPTEGWAWDRKSGKRLYTVSGLPSAAHRIAFSPDGGRVVFSGGGNGTSLPTATIRDSATGVARVILRGQQGVTNIAFSADGRRLVTTELDGALRTWDATRADDVPGDRGPFPPGGCVAVNRDVSRIAVGGPRPNSKEAHWVKVFDPAGRELLVFKGHSAPPTGLIFNPAGTTIASAAWAKGGMGALEFMTWDAVTGRVRFTLTIPNYRRLPPVSPESPEAAFGPTPTFSPDGGHVALAVPAGDKDDARWRVRIWDTSTGEQQVAAEPMDEEPKNVWISPDGRKVYAWMQTKGITCWDAVTGRRRWHLPLPRFQDISDLTPDGKYFLTVSIPREGEPGIVHVWDAGTGREINVLKPAPSAYAVYIGRDSRRVAVVVCPRGVTNQFHPGPWEVQIFDILTGAKVTAYHGHDLFVNGVAFSPDGRRVASLARNGPGDWGEVKVWDADTGDELLHLTNGAYGHWLTFSPDGRRLAMYDFQGGVRGTVAKVWDATLRGEAKTE